MEIDLSTLSLERNVSVAGALGRIAGVTLIGVQKGPISDDLAGELERDVNSVGAPLAGLVRSTRVDVAIFAVCVAAAVALVSWLAA